MKKIFKIIILIISILVIIKLLNTINNYEYKKAIKRCGNEKNIITNYTNQGEKYYTCKVEK